MKPSKRPRIIVAIDENIFSQVSASILRNQDYDLVAVHFAIDLEALGLNPDEFPSALKKSNLSVIEKFCSGIDIPLRVIDATEEIMAKIYDPFWMCTLTGTPSAPTLDWVSGFLIEKLESLAQSYKAEFFSTGHLARKLDEKPGGILRYSDLSLDQSDSFSRLSSSGEHDVLNRLVLPLGEVSLDRIVRLAQEMGLLKKASEENTDLSDGDLGRRELLRNHSERGQWIFTEALLQNPRVQARAAPEFFKPGPMRSRQELTLSDHSGIPFFKIGDPSRELPGQVVLEIRNESRTVILGPASELEIQRAFLKELVWSVKPNSSVYDLPIEAAVFGSRNTASGTLTLFPGSLGEMRLESPLSGLCAGQWIVFYEGGRVLGGGKIAEIPRSSGKQIPIEKDQESE